MEEFDMVILLSFLFKRTSCHYFSIKYNFLKEIIDDILDKLNDYNGNILEKVLFDYITHNHLIQKRRVHRSNLFSY